MKARVISMYDNARGESCAACKTENLETVVVQHAPRDWERSQTVAVKRDPDGVWRPA